MKINEEILEKAKELKTKHGKVSPSLLMRCLQLNYEMSKKISDIVNKNEIDDLRILDYIYG